MFGLVNVSPQGENERVKYVECCFALVGLGSAAVIYMYLVVSLPANKSSVFYLSPSP